eukprot:TRINITY_DN6264_c0_g2_i1.p1 TRINITY_DN6264_c0_g2~~TRINITY_DN6264_c0_g2_i1.p1  ORF type:complete len:663 (+),score=117.38 TRINITY_DN6264_c0_g2_i1:75-2063(+)
MPLLARLLGAEVQRNNPEEEEFGELFHTVMFICALWLSGKVLARIGMPALVAEIIVGILLGPELLNLPPHATALELLGELGLVLLMIEAGLHVDMETLQLVGVRALCVGILGSLLPMGVGCLFSYLWLGLEPLGAFAVGAALATMSTGIALNVLKAGGVLNSTVGQLIIAAATVNEMINISLLTELHAIARAGPWYTYVVPLVIMSVLVAGIGAAAICVVPKFLQKCLLPRFAGSQKESVRLACIFSAAVVFMPLCHYTGSSELLGAFLAGFCFCTDHHVHNTWRKQIKRVAAFLMRFFFACTIGFTIPIRDFLDPDVWKNAAILFACIIGKIGMGIFATPCDPHHFWMLAFSWGAWGEFSFILALSALDAGLFSKQVYSSIVLAVLMSILICPMMLQRTLVLSRRSANKDIDEAKQSTASSEIGELHSVYYCVQTRSHAYWGQQANLIYAVQTVGCKIIDFREFHPVCDLGSQHVVDEMYLKDLKMKLPLREQLTDSCRYALQERIKDIVDRVAESLQEEDPEIKVSRWCPGMLRDDLLYARGSSVRDFGFGAAASDGTTDDVTRLASLNSIQVAQAAFQSLEATGREFRMNQSRAFDNVSTPSSVRPNHELDGYVHRCRHAPFDGMDLLRGGSLERIVSESDESTSASDDSSGEGSSTEV